MEAGENRGRRGRGGREAGEGKVRVMRGRQAEQGKAELESSGERIGEKG